MMKHTVWITLMTAQLALGSSGENLMEVRVDQRFELMSIVCRLADFEEYRMGGITDYNAAVDAYFNPFKDHAAVEMARKLRSHVGFANIPSLAVRTADALRFRSSLDLGDPATGLDPDWRSGEAQAFLDAMAAFALDTKAETFFQVQAPFYQKLCQGCRDGLVSHLDPAWFSLNFGARESDTFTFNVAPLNGANNYGAWSPNARKGRDIFAIMGTPNAKAGQIPLYTTYYLPTLAHEFIHGFVNPWVERHLPDLRASGVALTAPVKDLMDSQAYGRSETVLMESLVRAFTVRYFRDHDDVETAEAEEQLHERLGFYWVKRLSQFLAMFTSRAEGMRNLGAVTPELVEELRGLATRADELSAEVVKAEEVRMEKVFEAGPRIVALDPPDGAKNVDPAQTVLRVTFDRPMGWAWGLVSVPGFELPTDGVPQWDAEGRVLTFTPILKPATTYKFWLNAKGYLIFKDRDRRPMRPTLVTFTTK